MTNWVSVPLDYVPLPGSSNVFVKETMPFDASELKKTSPARDRIRQAHFESELTKLAWHLGSHVIPVFLDFNGDRRRMDKGCVGQAVAAGILEQPTNGPEGFVINVILAPK